MRHWVVYREAQEPNGLLRIRLWITSEVSIEFECILKMHSNFSGPLRSSRPCGEGPGLSKYSDDEVKSFAQI
jgi:hypothetical protein